LLEEELSCGKNNKLLIGRHGMHNEVLTGVSSFRGKGVKM